MMAISLACGMSCYNAVASEKVVKVYILAGQSNMEGKGSPQHLDTYKDDPLIKPWYAKVRDGDGWAERDDVMITCPTRHYGGAAHGPLTIGYGSKPNQPDTIGPELGFGIAVGEATDAPVLIIKTAWGGKSIYQNFRPPSAMPSDAEFEQMHAKAEKKYASALAAHQEKLEQNKNSKAPKPVQTLDKIKESYGAFYRKMIAHVQEELATVESKFPELAGYKPELAGMVWHQGYNDMVRGDLRETKYVDYTKWLAMLIKDVRKDLNAPNLNVVIGELGTGGVEQRGDFQAAQAAVAELPEFKDSVVFVQTAQYIDPVAAAYYKKKYPRGTDEQKALYKTVGSDRPFHYYGSGKTYFLKGVAFGQAMMKLEQK